jgi:hypothetical protein
LGVARLARASAVDPDSIRLEIARALVCTTSFVCPKKLGAKPLSGFKGEPDIRAASAGRSVSPPFPKKESSSPMIFLIKSPSRK